MSVSEGVRLYRLDNTNYETGYYDKHTSYGVVIGKRRSRGELSRGEVPIQEVVEPGVDVIRTAVLGNQDNRRAPRRREVVWSSRPSRRFVEGAKRRLGELVEDRNSACRAGSVWPRPCSQSRKVATGTWSFLASCAWVSPSFRRTSRIFPFRICLPQRLALDHQNLSFDRAGLAEMIR